MANVIAGLAAQLSMDTTEFRKGISEAKNSLQELKAGSTSGCGPIRPYRLYGAGEDRRLGHRGGTGHHCQWTCPLNGAFRTNRDLAGGSLLGRVMVGRRRIREWRDAA